MSGLRVWAMNRCRRREVTSPLLVACCLLWVPEAIATSRLGNLLSLLMNPVTTYLDKRTYLLVNERKKIAERYICTWFLFDVCSTMPFEEVSRFFRAKLGLGFPLSALSMLCLWRLRRFSALFARLEKDIRFNYFYTRCAKLICVS